MYEEILAHPAACSRILAHLDARGWGHFREVNGATMAALCGVHLRSWQKWLGGERNMPEATRRLVQMVAWGEQ